MITEKIIGAYMQIAWINAALDCGFRALRSRQAFIANRIHPTGRYPRMQDRRPAWNRLTLR